MQENEKSKTTLCIEMLRVLSSGRIYKGTELANILETNPRNVAEYRKELQQAGYPINGVAGHHGGYVLDIQNSATMIPSIKLTDEEKKILRISYDYIVGRGDFLDTDVYQRAMAKVFSSVSTTGNESISETISSPGVTLRMSADELHKRYEAIDNSIKRNAKIIIDFLSKDNVVETRKIHPYKLVMSNNAWFVIGFCEMRNDIRYFKLNRIEGFKLTAERFTKRLSYNEREIFDREGFKVGGDWRSDLSDKNGKSDFVHVKLKLKGHPAMYVKEYVYGKNQTITPLDDQTTILECDMHYIYNTIRFILGFGSDCTVLEPEWLKDEIKKIAKEMAENI